MSDTLTADSPESSVFPPESFATVTVVTAPKTALTTVEYAVPAVTVLLTLRPLWKVEV